MTEDSIVVHFNTLLAFFWHHMTCCRGVGILVEGTTNRKLSMS